MAKGSRIEEMEFQMDELDLMIRQYRLEDFGDALMKSVSLIYSYMDIVAGSSIHGMS